MRLLSAGHGRPPGVGSTVHGRPTRCDCARASWRGGSALSADRKRKTKTNTAAYHGLPHRTGQSAGITSTGLCAN